MKKLLLLLLGIGLSTQVGYCAIALDAVTPYHQTASTTYSFNHTTSGSDRYLIVTVSNRDVGATAPTSVKYNGVSMSLLGSQGNGGASYSHTYGLLNPTVGTNSVAVTGQANTNTTSVAISYTGVSGTDGTNGASAYTNAISNSITTTVANDWIVSFGTVTSVGAGLSAGTGLTYRDYQDWTTAGNKLYTGDTNSGLSVGSNTVTMNSSASTDLGLFSVALKPVASATVSSGRFIGFFKIFRFR